MSFFSGMLYDGSPPLSRKSGRQKGITATKTRTGEEYFGRFISPFTSLEKKSVWCGTLF
jgi:hypothetical protein